MTRSVVGVRKPHNFLKISTGFILAVSLPMKKLARLPAISESASADALRLAETPTGSFTAAAAAPAASLAKAGTRLISHGVETGIEKNPRAYEIA